MFPLLRGIFPRSFSPTDLSWLVWLDGSDTSTLYQESTKITPATSDNDPVGAITDKSGNGNELIQAISGTRPTLKLNIQNGNSILRFSAHNLKKALATGAITQPFTVFLAVQLATAAIDDNTDRVILSSDDATNFIINYKRGDGAVPDFWRMYGDAKVLNGAVANDEWNIWTAVYNSTSSSFYINGNLQAGGDGGTDTPDGLTLGALFTGGTAWIGDFGELFIGQGVSDADRQSMENWLVDKWVCS